MCIWVRAENVPSVSLLIPRTTQELEHIVGFHLSQPMGYVKFDPFLCASMETVSGRINKTLLEIQIAYHIYYKHYKRPPQTCTTPTQMHNFKRKGSGKHFSPAPGKKPCHMPRFIWVTSLDFYRGWGVGGGVVNYCVDINQHIFTKI